MQNEPQRFIVSVENGRKSRYCALTLIKNAQRISAKIQTTQNQQKYEMYPLEKIPYTSWQAGISPSLVGKNCLNAMPHKHKKMSSNNPEWYAYKTNAMPCITPKNPTAVKWTLFYLQLTIMTVLLWNRGGCNEVIRKGIRNSLEAIKTRFSPGSFSK